MQLSKIILQKKDGLVAYSANALEKVGFNIEAVPNLKQLVIRVDYEPHQLFFTDHDDSTIAYRPSKHYGREEFYPKLIQWPFLTNLMKKEFAENKADKLRKLAACEELYKSSVCVVAYGYALTRSEYITLDAAQHHTVKKQTGKLPYWFDFSRYPKIIQQRYEVYGVPVMTVDEYEAYLKDQTNARSTRSAFSIPTYGLIDGTDSPPDI